MNDELWQKHLNTQLEREYEWEFKPFDKTNIQFRLNMHLLLRLQEYKKEGRVLDVGCDVGNMVQFLNDHGYQAEGLTLNPEHARTGSMHGLTIHVGDMHEMPLPDESYDIIWSTHTIEHALSPTIVIREMNRLLKPNGLLCIATPTNETDYAQYPYHHTCPTTTQLIHWQENNGFKVILAARPNVPKDGKHLLDQWQTIARKNCDWTDSPKDPLKFHKVTFEYDEGEEVKFN